MRHSLDDLRLSVTTLWDELGRTGPLLGLVVNTTCVLLGVSVWWFTTGWVAGAGAVFAILSALGILKWGAGL